MSHIEANYPFLRKLTSLTDGGDPRLDERNLLYSFGSLDGYVAVADFLIAITDAFEGIENEHLELAEGFVANQLAEEYDDIEPMNEKAFEFLSVVLTLGGDYDPSCIKEHLDTIKECMSNPEMLVDVEFDEESGYVLATFDISE